jgi:deazaflavin-dependent oxidoreductase (nitroreductase family)
MKTHKSAWHAVSEQIRYFNKYILNPIMLSWAGRTWSPYAVVRHRGRTSERPYSTPVLAMAHNDHFVIPLPYGKHVDWCKNVLANEGCFLTWKGATHKTTSPVLLPPEQGLPAFPTWIQTLLERSETEQYLRLYDEDLTLPQEPALAPWAAHRAREERTLMLIAGGIAGLTLVGLGLLLRRSARSRS